MSLTVSLWWKESAIYVKITLCYRFSFTRIPPAGGRILGKPNCLFDESITFAKVNDTVPNTNLIAMSKSPERISSLDEALQLVERDGAVILEKVDTSEAGAGQLMSELLGKSLRALPPPARVFEGGEKDNKLADTGISDPLPVHTDGFSYGDAYPDYMLLVCVQASAEGGENFLVDGYEVLENLAADSEYAWVAKALPETVVDQTEEGMQESLSPIVQKTNSGRVMVRRTFDMQGNDPKPCKLSENPARDGEMIRLWSEQIDQTADSAPRFKLAAGEAILVDNYRMFHGRTGYADANRMMWRVWGWSTNALKIPDQPIHSDSRYAGSDGS